jgi:hypothetical protein
MVDRVRTTLKWLMVSVMMPACEDVVAQMDCSNLVNDLKWTPPAGPLDYRS